MPYKYTVMAVGAECKKVKGRSNGIFTHLCKILTHTVVSESKGVQMCVTTHQIPLVCKPPMEARSN